MKRQVSAKQYGGTILQRGICLECGDECFICGDMSSSCCSAPTKPIEGGILVQEVSINRSKGRKPLNSKEKETILHDQENKCYWCGREFGSFIISPKGIVYTLTPVWDHYIPYAYTHSCQSKEFVASCSRCNSHKSSKIISTDEDEDIMKEMLKRQWYSGGWRDA